jgi:SAM-dependent methyltransferase
VPDPGLRRQLELSGYGAPGFAARYDAYRPRPPAILLDWLPALAGVERPRLVVDLGSGTGLSTRVWAGRAEEVVGVEPNDAMRLYAERATDAPEVRYVAGFSSATGLADAGVDIVTCSQSLQWMEPQPTLAEVARILRPGGVFAAYEYRALQTPFWEPEATWADVREAVGRLRTERGLDRDKRRWPVSLAALEETGFLEDWRELSLHSVEEGDAGRLIGLALSEGSMTTLLASGVVEHDVGLDRLRAVAAAWMPEPCPWLLSYRAWVARRR